MSIEIPCYNKKKGSVSAMQLMAIAKELNLDLPKKISKRELCSLLNAIQDKGKTEKIANKLKEFRGDVPKENIATQHDIAEKKFLVEFFTNYNVSVMAAMRAIETNDLKSIGNLLREKKHDLNDQSLLLQTIRRGNLETIKFLIDNGVKYSNDDESLAFFSVYYNKKDILQYFLDKGLPVTAKNNMKKQPKTIVNWAVENSIIDSNRNEARGDRIKYSKEFRDIDILKMLIAHKADINAVSSSGQTPLAKAVQVDNREAVQILLDNCVESKDFNGMNIAMYARALKRFEIMQMILEHVKNSKCKNVKKNDETEDSSNIIIPTTLGEYDEKTLQDSYTFAGLQIDIYAAISYFFHHYENVCFPGTMTITYDCNAENCQVNGGEKYFSDAFEACKKNLLVRFIIGFIDLTDGVNHHSNVFIVDMKKKDVDQVSNSTEIEIFEPNGTVQENFFQQKKYKQSLISFFNNNTRINQVVFLNDACPIVSFQGWQHNEKETKEFDPSGFCLAWTIWWIQYRLENPKFSREFLAKHANLELLKRRGKQSITDFIRNYAASIGYQREIMIQNLCKDALQELDKYHKNLNARANLRESVWQQTKDLAILEDDAITREDLIKVDDLKSKRKKDGERLQNIDTQINRTSIRFLENSITNYLQYEIAKNWEEKFLK